MTLGAATYLTGLSASLEWAALLGMGGIALGLGLFAVATFLGGVDEKNTIVMALNMVGITAVCAALLLKIMAIAAPVPYVVAVGALAGAAAMGIIAARKLPDYFKKK